MSYSRGDLLVCLFLVALLRRGEREKRREGKEGKKRKKRKKNQRPRQKMPHPNRKKKPTPSAGDRVGEGAGDGERKKPQPKLAGPTKRRQIEDEHGWTHVVDTPRRKSQGRGRAKTIEAGAQLLHAGDFERGGVAYVHRTAEELGADLEAYTKQWGAGEACAELNARLKVGEGGGEGEGERTGEARVRARVGDVVCLGLGSLQSARREGRRASFTQLAALRSILDVLGT